MHNMGLFDRRHDIFRANELRQPKGCSTRIPLCVTNGVAPPPKFPAVVGRYMKLFFRVCCDGAISPFAVCIVLPPDDRICSWYTLHKFVYEGSAPSFLAFLREAEKCRRPQKKCCYVLLLHISPFFFSHIYQLSWNIVILASKI